MKYYYDLKWLASFLISISIMTIFSGTSFLDIFVYADDLNPGVYPKDSKPFGIPIEEWLVKHTQWLFQTPYDVHPGGTYTPEKCSSSQSGPVWYLTLITEGNEQRTCTIPSDKAILLPILVGFCSEWDSKGKTITECAKEGNEHGVISATVDGKAIKDIKSYRTQSPIFNITVPENNVIGDTPGSGKGNTEGFFLFLEPLSPGNHTVQTTTSVRNPDPSKFGYNYGASLTYNLIVKP